MTTYLPNRDEAVLDIRKIEDYCLNPSHPRGRHKARVFREALDLQRRDAAIRRQGKSVVVRTIWIVRTGEIAPTFVTCWVL
jgi:hypothetical protein